MSTSYQPGDFVEAAAGSAQESSSLLAIQSNFSQQAATYQPQQQLDFFNQDYYQNYSQNMATAATTNFSDAGIFDFIPDLLHSPRLSNYNFSEIFDAEFSQNHDSSVIRYNNYL